MIKNNIKNITNNTINKIILFISSLVLQFILLFFSSYNLPIYAQNNENIEKTLLSLNINEDLSADIWYWIYLNNNSTQNLISSLTIDIPFTNISNLKIEKENQQIITYKSGIFENYTRFNIDFHQFSIYPKKKEVIKISFKVQEILKQQDTETNIYALILGELPVLNSSYAITYKKNLGDIIFTNIENYTKRETNPDEYTLDFVQNNNTLIIFGNQNKINVGFISTIDGNEDSESYYIFNLLPEINRQKHKYTTFYGAYFGLYDGFGNRYAAVKIDNNKKPFNFSAEVFLEKQNNLHKINKKYNVDISELENSLQEKLNVIFEGIQIDLKVAFKNLYKTVLEKSKIENYFPSNQELTYTSKVKSLNSQKDVCLTFIHFAEKFDVNAVIKYGYLVYPELLSLEFGMPHLWCEIEINNNVYVLDAYLETITKQGFSFTYPLDRITMGIWHQDQKYNNVLGLTNKKYQKIIRNNLPKNNQEENQIQELLMLLSNFNKQVTSGNYVEGNIIFQNNTNQFIEVENISIKEKFNENNTEITIGNLNLNSSNFASISEDLKFGILPLGNSLRKITFLPVTDFNFEGEKVFKIEAKTTNPEYFFEKDIQLKFEKNNSLSFIPTIIFEYISLIILCLSLFFVFIYILYKRKQKFLLTQSKN